MILLQSLCVLANLSPKNDLDILQHFFSQIYFGGTVIAAWNIFISNFFFFIKEMLLSCTAQKSWMMFIQSTGLEARILG